MTGPLLGAAVLALFLGLLGWKAASLLKIPAPAMIGPMLALAIAVSAGAPRTEIPFWLRIAAQSMIGGFIGRRVDRDSLRSAARMLPAIALTSAWYLATALGIGYLVAAWGRIETGTALLATAPAGVAEMTALAISVGADSAFVATMQALRVLAVNLTVPFAVRRRFRGQAELAAETPAVAAALTAAEAAPGLPEAGGGKKAAPSLPWLLGLAASLGGGFLLTWLQIPAGAVVGGMLALAALRIAGANPRPVPRAGITGAYMVLGISVGLGFGSGTLARLTASAGVIAFGTAATLASGLLLAFLIRRLLRLDTATALLSCSPAGLSLMAVVSEETGAQTLIVSLFQLMRVVWVILVMPILLRILG